MKRFIAVLIIAGVLGGVGWRIYAKLGPAAAPDAKGRAVAVAVEVAPVSRTTIRDIERFTGTLIARGEFIVAPKVAGRLVNLFADIGDTVTNGQDIALLDREEYTEQVKQASAELEVAKASVDEAASQLDAARREFDRANALRDKKIASESELDAASSQYRTAEARHKVAVAQVAQKEAALATAQVRLSYTKIAATWQGASDNWVIGERFANEGTMLKANDPIVSVIDIDELTAIIYVTDSEYAKVRVGQIVMISCDAYAQPFTGTIARVAPLVKETSREARVEISVLNAERLLRPGMFIRAVIEFGRYENCTAIPVAALAKRDEKEGVFLADLANRKARFVPVTLGVKEGGLFQVLDPTLDGYVVTLGQHLLEDGAAITVANEEDLAAGTEAPATRPVGTEAARGQPGAKS